MVRKIRPTMEEYLGESAIRYEKRRGLKRIKVKTTLIALDLLNLPKGSYILDVGCGSGWSTEVIKSYGYKVVGIDVSEEMIKIAREKGYDVELMDMRNMKFEDSKFDGIISISALNFVAEGCKNEEEIEINYKAAAKEMYRVLRSGGKAVIEYYPKTKKEEEISMKAFLFAGFSGELIKNSYKKKRGQRFLNLIKGEKPVNHLFIKYRSYRF
ncbi:MAG: class I SAM-dependent methyltransferase [Candidatus Aenigmatarchaeota archaeon]